MSTPAPFLSPAFLRDPYPTYAASLAGPPIQPFAMLPGVFGVFGYDHCTWLLRNVPLSSSLRVASFFPAAEFQRGDYQDLFSHIKSWLLMTDAPEHTRLRKLMNPGFTPIASERLRPQVEATVAQLLEAIAHVDEPDLLRDLGLSTARPCDLAPAGSAAGAGRTLRSSLGRRRHVVRQSGAYG